MQPEDFDDILQSARQVRQAIAEIYRDVTGEDLDLEGAVRHYPVIALGLAAGAGAAAGWFFARRTQALPPPRQETLPDPGTSPLDRMRERIPQVSVSPEVASAAKGWFSRVVEPKLRENLDAAARSISEGGLSSVLDSAASMLDSRRDVQMPDPNDDSSEPTPPKDSQ